MHGITNPKFLESNYFDYNSHPKLWYKGFVPSRFIDCGTRYTNIKVMIHKVGQKR